MFLALPRLALLVLALLVIAVVGTATATSNEVARSGLSEHSEAITARDLAPPECSNLSLSTVVTGSGSIIGSASNDLILGGAGADSILGGAGNDCIVGGGGDDALDGEDGADVCISGPGADTFTAACESQY